MNSYLKEYKKKVCIVGNSDSLLGKNMGYEIDSHDIVVRINHCYTINLEKDTGSKCTHWAINQIFASNPSFIEKFFIPRINELKLHGLHTIIRRTDPISSIKNKLQKTFGDAMFNEAVGEQLDVLSLNFKREVSKNPHLLPVQSKNMVETTGLGLIYYFLRRYRHVNIIGFGSPENVETIRHYWPPKAPDLSKNFIKHKHIMDVERQIINNLPVIRLDA